MGESHRTQIKIRDHCVVHVQEVDKSGSPHSMACLWQHGDASDLSKFSDKTKEEVERYIMFDVPNPYAVGGTMIHSLICDRRFVQQKAELEV